MIRTDRSPVFIPIHNHKDFKLDAYITATIAPVGWNTYYMRGRKKALSRLGHTTILTEPERIKTFLENKEPPDHGTPYSKRKRLLLISFFKKVHPTIAF